MLAGCSLGTRTFGLSFPAEGGIRELPVVLTDYTGLVADVNLPNLGVPHPGPHGGHADGMNAVPGQPNALEVDWVGGMCDASVDIVVRGGDKLAVTLATQTRPGGCLLAGIGRRLVITFTRPMLPGDVTLATS
jgi:hypothetical protein